MRQRRSGHIVNISSIGGIRAFPAVGFYEAIIKAVEAEEAPLHLLLGKAALSGANWKLELLRRNFDAWRDTTVGADFPEGE